MYTLTEKDIDTSNLIVELPGLSDNFNHNHRKENWNYDNHKIIACYTDIDGVQQVVSVLDCNVYFKQRAQTVYCAFWLHSKDNSTNLIYSTGKASGYGYDKVSTSIADTINRAGIKITDKDTGKQHYFAGTGEFTHVLMQIAKTQFKDNHLYKDINFFYTKTNS